MINIRQLCSMSRQEVLVYGQEYTEEYQEIKMGHQESIEEHQEYKKGCQE